MAGVKKKLKSSNNGDFWIKKISANRERDKMVNQQLTDGGWTVIRFWGKDIKKNIDDCVNIIKNAISISQNIHM